MKYLLLQIVFLLASVQSVTISKEKKDYFDKDPFSVSPGDQGHHDVTGLQEAIERDKINEKLRIQKMREEADPSGSMKIKAELDQERKKLGIKTDEETKK